MTMTAEQKKIRRLEKLVQELKEDKEHLTKINANLHMSLSYERRWRQDFQNLVKAAIQEDRLEDYESTYRSY